ncbi:MBL fold metallo-hydrolase [Antribacter gilvus]|uniref:MBL fold metallo-hydrolase n=1 Tax=Antribacter gilvus TaxID=2304675 RepID=UPI000F78C20C|nr:MBL fold metallo-hydrolase [Antribacter gilvus]
MTFIPVADGVLVRTSRRMSTTTTLALGPDRAGLLVDPSWDADELEAIADEVDGLGVRVAAGFSTHAHHDHLLWHPRYGDVPRWASAGTVRMVREHGEELRESLLGRTGSEPSVARPYPDEVLDLFAQVSEVPAPSAGLPDPAGALPATEVVVHDGHAPGHSALWLPGPRVLLAGDMLSDEELPLPLDPDDLPAYVEALDRLRPYVGAAVVLVPGHGTPSYSPAERLDADRRYLDAVLAGEDPDDPRRANPGMAEVHERVVRLAAELR